MARRAVLFQQINTGHQAMRALIASEAIAKTRKYVTIDSSVS